MANSSHKPGGRDGFGVVDVFVCTVGYCQHNTWTRPLLKRCNCYPLLHYVSFSTDYGDER